MKKIQIQYDEKGLVPVIVQDAISKEVLTLAYMNEASLQKTIEERETWFYSRSRQKLWHKGETSGYTQQVQSIAYDCDADAILVQVIPQGPACHRGTYSCFQQTERVSSGQRFDILHQLETVIAAREAERPAGAYTTYLFEQGIDKILKKIGEESAEVIIAAKNGSDKELCLETADLIYHLLVLLRQAKLSLDGVWQELARRLQSKQHTPLD
jgi:phosphoribosyl-AMP cyclohydrolase / phosphoribosyl-ATP pyrophosphohydrolase